MVRGKKCPVCGRYHIFKHKTVSCAEHAKNLGLDYHAPVERKDNILDTGNTDTARSVDVNDEPSQTQSEQSQPAEYTLPPAEDVLQTDMAGDNLFSESEDNQPVSQQAPSEQATGEASGEGFKIGIGSRENIMVIKWLVKELAEVEVKDSDFDPQDVQDLDRAYQKAGLSKEVSDPKVSTLHSPAQTEGILRCIVPLWYISSIRVFLQFSSVM